jgi:hypothetical protein
VFLAHALEDAAKIRSLATVLRAAKFEPVLGTDSVLAGRRWEDVARQTVRTCDFFVPCLSRAALDRSGRLHAEIRLALDRCQELPESAVFMIPARLDECDVPWSLAEYRPVDLFSADGPGQLLRALRA